MSVLPPRSCHAVPAAHQKLMLDKNSKICDFYPEDFKIDMNGARMAWMGVALLPFLDEDRCVQCQTISRPLPHWRIVGRLLTVLASVTTLYNRRRRRRSMLAAIRPLEATLTPEEKHRNSVHPMRMFVSGSHPNCQTLSRTCPVSACIESTPLPLLASPCFVRVGEYLLSACLCVCVCVIFVAMFDLLSSQQPQTTMADAIKMRVPMEPTASKGIFGSVAPVPGK